MSLPRVLLTGFEPFDGELINPAMEVVHELAGERIAGHRVEPATLPVSFAEAPGALYAAIDRVDPVLVLCVGQAGGRARISLERCAVNLIDARVPDNDGAQPVDVPVIAAGPAGFFSTLPVKAMLQAMQASGVPAELSLSAGTYVCNAVFYALMHRLSLDADRVRGGFVHIPYLPVQAARHPGTPCMALGTLGKGLGIAIEAALTTAQDLRLPGGTIA